MSAETAHNAASAGLSLLQYIPGGLALAGAGLEVRDPRLDVSIGSLRMPNPVGLAAGFDKHITLACALQHMGFGFLEVGTITPFPQPGRDKPRLFRVTSEKALINRMGFNNPGAAKAAENLKELRPKLKIPIGINIGKGKDTPIERGFEDYASAFEQLSPYADYVVLNVSSPNTVNLRALQESKLLEEILVVINSKKPQVPVFVKVAPDATDEQLEDIARLSITYNIGLVATNTTVDRTVLALKDPQEGGISGAPVRSKANAVLKKLYKLTRGGVPIIGVGGIFSAEDAYEKIRLGASLIQVYTGWIYQGPGLVAAINKGLLRFLDRDGFKNVKDAVGTL